MEQNLKPKNLILEGTIIVKTVKEYVQPDPNCEICFGRGYIGLDEKGNKIPCKKCKKIKLLE